MKCNNSRDGKCKEVQNAIRTHWVCQNCTRIIRPIEKFERQPKKGESWPS